MADPGPPPSAEAPAMKTRPFVVLVASHWLSLVGVSLALAGLLCWLFLLPLQMRGHAENPYIGILAFVVLPLVFFLGLGLTPIGVFLARRRVRTRFQTEVMDRSAAYKRLALVLGVTTAVNAVVGTQLTYRAVEHMETAQFCGSCHVMTPEFKSHENMPHAQITCVQCHVTPGVGGWVESKMAGTRQLMEVVFDTHQRPIPSALETNRLVPSNETCEQCHWRELPGSVRLRVISKFAEDEANTPTQTVLTVLVGGGNRGGIHGATWVPASRSDTRPRTRSGRSSRGSNTRTAAKASRARTSGRRPRPRRWRPCRSTRCSASIATIAPPTRSIRPRGRWTRPSRGAGCPRPSPT